MAYFTGNVVRCFASFINTQTGLALDPTDVYFKSRTPGGAITTLHYLADPAVVRESQGHYHVDVDAQEVGFYRYRWYSTGTGQAADESYFEAKESEVV